MERDFQQQPFVANHPVGCHLTFCDEDAFLDRWANALLAYGTPTDFVSSVRYIESRFEMNGAAYPLVIPQGGNYRMRAQLMARQRRYDALGDSLAYPVSLRPDGCFLCQNIQQAIDAERDATRPSNVMFDLGSHYIFPNRYPAHRGSSLFVPKDHDDHERRVDICARRLEDEFGIRTLGRLVGPRDLRTLFQFADAHNLLAARNHVLDGMSIPCHDHFHLHSAALPSSRFFCQLIEDEHSKSGPPERFPQATPFATLFLIDSDRAALAQRAAEVIGRLEFGHIVYTAAYWQGGFALSPRTCDVSVDRIPKVGGDVPMHSFDPEEPGVLEHIQRHVLRRGQFDWRPFIKH